MKPGPATVTSQRGEDLRRQRRHQLVGDRAGRDFGLSGVGQDAIGLKVAVRRVGGAHLRGEFGGIQSGGAGGGFQCRLEVGGWVEGDRHDGGRKAYVQGSTVNVQRSSSLGVDWLARRSR
jgi:hypothetical protein